MTAHVIQGSKLLFSRMHSCNFHTQTARPTYSLIGSESNKLSNLKKPKCEIGGARKGNPASGVVEWRYADGTESSGVVKTDSFDPITEMLAFGVLHAVEVPTAEIKLVEYEFTDSKGVVVIDLGVVSCFGSDPNVDAFQIINKQSRARATGLRGKAYDLTNGILGKNHILEMLKLNAEEDLNLEEIIAGAMLIGERDVHLGNIILILKEGKFEFVKIDNGAAFTNIFHFCHPFKPNEEYGEIFKGKPTNHFNDYSYAGGGIFFRSPKFIAAFERQHQAFDLEDFPSMISDVLEQAVKTKFTDLINLEIKDEKAMQWLSDYAKKHLKIKVDYTSGTTVEQLINEISEKAKAAMRERRVAETNFLKQLKEECLKPSIEDFASYAPLMDESKTIADLMLRIEYVTGIKFNAEEITTLEALKAKLGSLLKGSDHENNRKGIAKAQKLCELYIKQRDEIDKELEHRRATFNTLREKVKSKPKIMVDIIECYIKGLKYREEEPRRKECDLECKEEKKSPWQENISKLLKEGEDALSLSDLRDCQLKFQKERPKKPDDASAYKQIGALLDAAIKYRRIAESPAYKAFTKKQVLQDTGARALWV